MKHLFLLLDTPETHKVEPVIRKVLKDEEVIIKYTSTKQEVLDHIASLKEPHRIYSVGGDGAINLTIQKMVHTDHELCVLPLGTGNDFMRMFTSETDIETLLRYSLTAEVKKIDTVQVTDHYFINTSCFGIDAVVADHVHDTPDIPFLPESKRYVVSIIQNVLKFPFYPVTIKKDDKIIYKNRITLFAINNGQYYGGGFSATPMSKIDDGIFEVCVVDQMPLWQIPYYLIKLVKKDIEGMKKVHYFYDTELDVEINETVNLDGEEMMKDHYHYKMHPQSLNLVMYK